MQSRIHVPRHGSVLLLVLACALPVGAQEMPAIQAARASGAPLVDGKLDDPAWKGVVVFADFIQQVPVPGAPARDALTLSLAKIRPQPMKGGMMTH